MEKRSASRSPAKQKKTKENKKKQLNLGFIWFYGVLRNTAKRYHEYFFVTKNLCVFVSLCSIKKRPGLFARL